DRQPVAVEGLAQPQQFPAGVGEAALAVALLRQLVLRADEPGAVGGAVVLEPVGVDQQRRQIRGALAQLPQEGLFVAHGRSPTRPAPRRARLGTSGTAASASCSPASRRPTT